MAANDCSPGQALSKMASLLHAATFDRTAFMSLFETALKTDRESACRRYIDGIEVMMRRKMNPEDDILRAYSILGGNSLIASVADVLKDIRLQTRTGLILRRQACRALVNHSDILVPISALQDIAVCGDAGRLAVIDFLVTRGSSTAEYAELVVQLVNEMGKSQLVVENSRRCEYIRRLLRRTNTVSSLAPKLPKAIQASSTKPEVISPKIEMIVSAMDIKHNLPRIQHLSEGELSRWLLILRRASTDSNSYNDKSRCAISNILVNISRNYHQNPIVIDILAVSLDFEAMLAEPSMHIFDKVQRVVVTVIKHGPSAIPILVNGLALCIKKLGYTPEQGICGGFDEAHVAHFKEIAQSLNKLGDWQPLVDAVVDFHDPQVRAVIAQLLVFCLDTTHLTRDDCEQRRHGVNRIMRLALMDSTQSMKARISLNEVYAFNFGCCFDVNEIGSYIEDSNLDARLTFMVTALRAHTAPTANEAYRYSKALVSLVEHGDVDLKGKPSRVLHRMLQAHAFIDIAHRLGLELTVHEDQPVAKSELASLVAAAHCHLPPLAGIHAAYRAFRVLRKLGNHFDACCVLQIMLLRARDLTGETGVRYRAYRRALKAYMRDELELPQDVLQTLVIEKYGDDDERDPLDDGLEESVISISNSILSRPEQRTIDRFESDYRTICETLSSNSQMSIMTDSVMAVPPLVVFSGRNSRKNATKMAVEAEISRLLNTGLDLSALNWIDRLRIAEKMMPLSCIASSLRCSQSILTNIDPCAAEKTQGEPISSTREYLGQRSQGKGALTPSAPELTEPPVDIICISLSFDSTNTLVLTRREKGYATISVRLPEKRMASLTNHKQPVSYPQAVDEINKIINESGSVEASGDTPSERSRFWTAQYALDDRMQKHLILIQRSWIGGFGKLLSPEPGALEVEKDALTALGGILQRYISKLPLKSISLSPALAACIRSAALVDSLDQLEDLLSVLLNNLVFQGVTASLNEVDMRALMADLRQEVFRCTDTSKPEPKHIVLVCDRKANAIPWEMLPVLQERSVSRAISLNQVVEWALERENRKVNGTDRRSQKVTAILNPQRNLPQTQERFDTEFRLRGWRGYTGVAPTHDQFIEAFTSSDSLVYVGHGSGAMLAEHTVIRRLFLTQTGVYLFGCSSVALQYPFFSKEPMTSYAAAGSREIIGTLWNVKDKDCNRFTAEFLGRVFDDHEHIGKAMWESRKACMLPYLTSAAWVLYGLP